MTGEGAPVCLQAITNLESARWVEVAYGKGTKAYVADPFVRSKGRPELLRDSPDYKMEDAQISPFL
jgi:hypothetical protein